MIEIFNNCIVAHLIKEERVNQKHGSIGEKCKNI